MTGADQAYLTNLVVAGVSLLLSLVLIISFIRTSISTRRTALLLERTNELLEKIAEK